MEDLLNMLDKRSSNIGGGWGSNMLNIMEGENKIYESVNTVSLAINDYRRHYYKSVSPSKLKVHPDDVEWFLDDPIDFLKQFGYYYVIGLTTGSSFEGAYNYYSENR
jgi:hypothetical protein